jgi:hypothetical protein
MSTSPGLRFITCQYLALPTKGREISASTNPRDDLANPIANLKVAADVLNALVAAKLAAGIDKGGTGKSTDPRVAGAPVLGSGLPADIAHLDA